MKDETQNTETIVIREDEQDIRLDKVLASRFKEIRSRTYFQRLIDDKCVLVNGAPVKKREKPAAGDEVEIFFQLTNEIGLAPEPIPLDILYEDDAIICVNKQAGLVVHPAPGNPSGTFVNALLYHCKNLPQKGENFRPGIVHRLDKDTSGVIVAAKTVQAQVRLIEMFSGRQVYKEYQAIVLGNPGEATISEPIGRHPVHRQKMAVIERGRSAVTHVKTIHFDGKLSIVEIVIETGRTHQIRVHLNHRRTPVLGDSVYGNVQANKLFGAKRQMLHAKKLRFKHPITEKMIEIEAEIPDDMMAFVDRIKRGAK